MRPRQILLALLLLATGAALANTPAWVSGTGGVPTLDASTLDPTCLDERGNRIEIRQVTVNFATRRVTVTSNCGREANVPAFQGDLITLETAPRFVMK